MHQYAMINSLSDIKCVVCSLGEAKKTCVSQLNDDHTTMITAMQYCIVKKHELTPMVGENLERVGKIE